MVRGVHEEFFHNQADAGQKVVGEALFEQEPNLVDPASGTIEDGHVTTRSAQEFLKNSPGRFTLGPLPRQSGSKGK